MPYQRISVTDKTRLIEAYNREEDYHALATHLNIKRETAYAIIRRSILGRDGLVERARGGNRRALVDSVMTAKMVEIIESHPSFTLRQINRSLQIDIDQQTARHSTGKKHGTNKAHEKRVRRMVGANSTGL